jgi:hypothetical protein
VVFDLDVVFHLVLDVLVLLCKDLLQIVDFALFLFQFVPHTTVLLFVVFQFIFQ